jgi:hypothetical protein
LSLELESHFQVHGTPDKNTLVTLKLDPIVNTTAEDCIFSSRTTVYQLMMGEYIIRLVGWNKLMFVASKSDSSPVLIPVNCWSLSMTGVAKKGPSIILSRVIPVHYLFWLEEVGCAKVAIIKVEMVFSGAGCISMKSMSLPAGPHRLALHLPA